MIHRYFVFASLTILPIAVGCGTEVISGNTGGFGGDTGSTTTNISTGTIGVTTATTTATTTSTTTTTGAGGSGGSASASPPPPGPMNTPDGMGSSVFAISKILFGDTNPDGTPNFNAWKDYGYDLDGHISTATSTGLCKPRKNAAPKTVYPDGVNGIDNSFGKNILPIFLGLASDFSSQANKSIAEGKRTVLLDLENLGAGPSYYPLLSRWYEAGNLGFAPNWNGQDAWPVTSESLASPPSLASAKAQAPQSYVVGNTWVAPIQSDITLSVDLAGFVMKIPIRKPIVTMMLDAAHQNAAGGIIAGVIPTDAFVASVKQLAGNFDPTLCNGPTIDSIAAQIEQASDILTDGTQDPTKECNGISIGLGFEARAAKFGPVNAPVPPPPNPCGP